MATESFALHNLGSNTLPVMTDTHGCHATEGRSAKPPQDTTGTTLLLNKGGKKIFPQFFTLQEGVILDFKEQRRAQPAWGPCTVTVAGLQHPD